MRSSLFILAAIATGLGAPAAASSYAAQLASPATSTIPRTTIDLETNHAPPATNTTATRTSQIKAAPPAG